MKLSEHIRALLEIGPEDHFAESGGVWWSWGEAANLVAGLGAILADAGCTPGSRVGLLMRNRAEHVAAFATLFVERLTLVPLNPHLGTEGLASEVRSLRLPVIIASEDDWSTDGLRDAVTALSVVGVKLPSSAGSPPGILGRSQPGPDVLWGDDEAVAVEMLTSGTTGPSKRVPLRRSWLERALEGAHEHQNGPRSDLTAQHRTGLSIVTNPPVHMSGLTGLIRVLGEGRPMALLERFTVEAWVDVVLRHRPKVLNLVPTALRMILDAHVPTDVFQSVRVVTTGTAPAPPALILEFEERYGVPILVNYGATEFAGGVAGWSLSDHRAWRDAKLGSVGRAYPGVGLQIVDPKGDHLVPGEIGILEVRMPGRADESFQRTNDIASIDSDGFLWIHGRADGAINRGGFKILAEEVQRVLEEHPSVREACVVALPDRRLGEVPVAAVELRSDAEPVDADTLLAFARMRLTSYQVPAQLVIIPNLPRTSGLKVPHEEVRALFRVKSSTAQ